MIGFIPKIKNATIRIMKIIKRGERKINFLSLIIALQAPNQAK